MNANTFNSQFPIGIKVKYFPISGEPDFIETETRSEAWELGSGHVVVKIKGKTGGVSIEHLMALPCECDCANEYMPFNSCDCNCHKFAALEFVEEK